ncbi:MAG: AAA family ATPase, partial [Brevinema sp.]
DASNMLKPALARGLIRTIGATTFEEYKKRIEKDKAFVRRFQMVRIDEPSLDETVTILTRLKSKYEEYHNVTFTPQALKTAVQLASRYMVDRYFPDKAIDIMDEAGAQASTMINDKPEALIELEVELSRLESLKNDLVKNQQYENASELRDSLRQKREELAIAKEEWTSTSKRENILIDTAEICKVVSRMTDIPVQQLDADGAYERYLHLEETLAQTVKGQPQAVKAIAQAVKKNSVGIRDFKKPMGSFILLGPTGVGKTELAKSITRFLFGTEDALIRVDMSEFMEKHTSSRLLGAPPGYVGHENGGELTERVKRRPYSVVLFDEIEKAHPDIFNTFLQILDEGHITDSLGEKISFKNTLIIFTSNLGTDKLTQKSSLGFSDPEGEYEKRKDLVIADLKRYFRPEFLNRLDDTIVFNPLDTKTLEDICTIMLSSLNENVKLQGIRFDAHPDVLSVLVEKGFEAKYGARSLRRAITKLIEIPVSELILQSGTRPNPEIEVLEVHIFKDKESNLGFKLKTKKLINLTRGVRKRSPRKTEEPQS